jgi:hypothetical protein
MANASLLASEGFHVYEDDRFVGVAAEVLVDEPDGSVTALVVSRGWFGRDATRAEAQRVTGVAPLGDRIYVRPSDGE